MWHTKFWYTFLFYSNISVSLHLFVRSYIVNNFLNFLHDNALLIIEILVFLIAQSQRIFMCWIFEKLEIYSFQMNTVYFLVWELYLCCFMFESCAPEWANSYVGRMRTKIVLGYVARGCCLPVVHVTPLPIWVALSSVVTLCYCVFVVHDTFNKILNIF